MPEAHAMLSASGSAKWLNCSAALALEALINEPDTGNEYADEGTAAHEVLEQSLKQNREPSTFLGLTISVNKGEPNEVAIDINQEMVDNVEIAIEYIQRPSARNSFYEERVDYSHIAKDGFGTSDVLLEVYEKVATNKRVNTLYVIDFKYGAGIKVDAFENSQGMLYALGALNSLDILFEREIERVNIVIIQPRMDNISEYEISVADLLKWGDSIKPKAQKAYDLYEKAIGGSDIIFNPENFNPTKDGCKWCQGRRLTRCKAHAHTGYQAAIDGFEDLTSDQKCNIPAIEVSDNTFKDPYFLDNKDLAAIYVNMQMFLTFAESLTAEITSRINSGQTVPGLRLIPTEKPRAWKFDEEETIKAIRTAGLQKVDYLKWAIISPTEAQNILKKVKPKDHNRRYKRLEANAIHRPPGNDKIIEDKRKPAEEIDDRISLEITEDDLLGFDLLE